MDFGICLQSVIPVRIEPSHKSEMVTQILFGELYRVIENQDHWIRVQLAYDNYEGWIDQKQSFPLDEEEYIRLINAETQVSLDLVQLLSNERRRSITTHSAWLLASGYFGSQVFNRKGNLFF